jgi:hypothetical protein
MNFGISNSFNQQQKNAYVQQQYKEIYAHEQAHKRAAGSFGGSIVIEKDSNGIPTGGHVDILMPTLNKEKPDETIKHAETVINAAMAPGDPSEQDYKVAAEARAIKAEAENYKSKNGSVGQNLNVVA